MSTIQHNNPWYPSAAPAEPALLLPRDGDDPREITLTPLLETATSYASHWGADQLAAMIAAHGTEEALLARFVDTIVKATAQAIGQHDEQLEEYSCLVLAIQMFMSGATEGSFELSSDTQRLTLLEFVARLLINGYLAEAGYVEEADPYMFEVISTWTAPGDAVECA